MAILLSILTFFSTMCGGLFGIKFKDKLHLILGFTAGVLLSLVCFDILPEIINRIASTGIDVKYPLGAIVVGFMIFHIVEKSILIHNSQENSYSDHHHSHGIGIASAIALSGHSFLDGVGIGLAFHVSEQVGFIVAVAVIAHDFSDGLNTASLMLVNKNTIKKSLVFVFIDAIAPVFGALSTLLFTLPENFLIIYLGFFAGFLLYISASDILPEAHREKSSYKTIAMTMLGILFIFTVTTFLNL